MLKYTLTAILFLLILPFGALKIGDHFQEQIENSANSAEPWRQSKLAYRIAMFSPVFWGTAERQAHQTDLRLSENFFQEVLRGERDAIVPDDHLAFLENRPDTQAWKEIRLYTLMSYGQFSEVLVLAPKMLLTQTTAKIASHASFYIGNIEQLEYWCSEWEDCPTGWKKPEYFSADIEDWNVEYEALEPDLRPVFIEHLLVKELVSPEEVSKLIIANQKDTKWICTELAFLEKSSNPTSDPEKSSQIISKAWAEVQYLSIGNLPMQTICHFSRFEALESIAPKESLLHLQLLTAHSHITQFNISSAQKKLKEIEDPSVLPEHEQSIFWQLRLLAREAAGDAAGMEKYALQGMPINKAIFSVELAKAKFYQQSKTTALQHLSSLNGYPINPALEQEYKDMFSFAKRLNGSSSKTKIGSQELEYNFMDNDGDFREWLVRYIAETIDQSNNDDLGLIILRFWRGEDKHGDQLLNTHLESKTSFNSVLQTKHQRLLHASLRGDSSLSSSTWKSFSESRAILYNIAYPQLIHSKAEDFSAPFPRDAQ